MLFRRITFACVWVCLLLGSRANAIPFTTDLSAANSASALQYIYASGYWNGKAMHVTFNPASYAAIFFPFTPIDWSNVQAVALDVENTDTVDHTIALRLDDVHNGTGSTDATAATAVVGAGQRGTYLFPISVLPTQYGMHLLPPVSGNWLDRDYNSINFGHAAQWMVFEQNVTESHAINIYSIKPAPVSSFTGCIDGFGQYAFATWTGKASTVADLVNQKNAEAQDLAAHPKPSQFDAYGGYVSGPLLTATGRFYTTQYGGRWWLVDPAGRLFFSAGINEISRGVETILSGRESLFNPFPNNAAFTGQITTSTGLQNTYNYYKQNIASKYGANYLTDFYSVTVQRLWSWGFNTVGNWSFAPNQVLSQVPYVGTGVVSGSYASVPTSDSQWGPVPDPYDPSFAPAVVSALEAESYAFHDPMCMGWFVDNEVGWSGGTEENGRYGLAYGVLSLNASTSPAKRQFVSELQAKYGTIAALNTAWQTHFASWSSLALPVTSIAQVGTSQRKADFQNFIYQYALLYFQTVKSSLAGKDSGALYLGCRFVNPNALDVIEACAQTVDVMSFNIYAQTLDPNVWNFLTAYNKPAIVSEFSFGALDSGMFWTGEGFAVNQGERATRFTAFVNSVINSRQFVGCHWFAAADDPTTGAPDGENANYGFVSGTDLPYPSLVSAARSALGATMYRTRTTTINVTHRRPSRIP